MGDFGHEGVVGVGVGEQARNGEQNFRNGEGGAPLVFENVEADGAVLVDVGVINLSHELYLRRAERVVIGELNLQEEKSTLVGTALGADDGRLPIG